MTVLVPAAKLGNVSSLKLRLPSGASAPNTGGKG